MQIELHFLGVETPLILDKLPETNSMGRVFERMRLCQGSMSSEMNNKLGNFCMIWKLNIIFEIKKN